MISGRYLPYVRSHLDRVISTGLAAYGPHPCAMWMASLDTRTGKYPEDDTRPPHIGKRVYRNIDAPRGCSLYWDQPSIVAAHELSRLTGDPRYRQAADEYTQAFLQRCVAGNGMFLWGNHYYYDAFRAQVLWFVSDEEPKPVDMTTETGWLHELRPLVPAWETFWQISPSQTEKAIRQLAKQHIFDPEQGGFNRHADGHPSHAFLEAGGVLVVTLCWLAAKTGDQALADQALRVARFSWRHRDPVTNLVENNPTTDRWDKFCCTTEVGLWAGYLLRAAERVGSAELEQIADGAMSAYLRYGYDRDAGRYYGKLCVKDGAPCLGPKETPYQPGDYADIWNALFPTHDYPLPFAECCLALWQRTGDARYAEAVSRWAEIIRRETPAAGGRGAYAENYGRCIYFLCDAARITGQSAYWEQAADLADEALTVLYTHGMFRGHPGEERYDAVDGVGYLLLALLYLDRGEPPELLGLAF